MSFHLTLPTILNQLVNGFALGTLLVLMAVGLTIILGLMRVINFTHGVLYALGAYTVVSLTTYTGFWPCLLIGPILLGLVGMGMESTLIRRVYAAGPASHSAPYLRFGSDDRRHDPHGMGRCGLSQ